MQLRFAAPGSRGPRRPGWRNWQTRQLQVLVGYSPVEVRVLFPGTNIGNPGAHGRRKLRQRPRLNPRELKVNIYPATTNNVEKTIMSIAHNLGFPRIGAQP